MTTFVQDREKNVFEDRKTRYARIFRLFLLCSMPPVQGIPFQLDKKGIKTTSSFHSKNLTALRCGSTASEHAVERLPAGRLRPRVNFLLWKIPFLAGLLSFGCFRSVTQITYQAINWASQRTWLPTTEEQMNLQTNVVTQVVNGPVITSISVLFASLLSTTIANLHSRQVAIQRSLVWEIHHLRELQLLMDSPLAQCCLSRQQHEEAKTLIQGYRERLLSQSTNFTDPHLYIESNLRSVSYWCDSVLSHYHQIVARRPTAPPVSPEALVDQIRRISTGLLEGRVNQWTALLSLNFPFVHYLTLSVLAISILVSFIVATAQGEVLFRSDGLQSVRILWSLLIMTFAALGVLCYDLSRPFGGSYKVEDVSQ